jgi:hypothetical protein
MIDIKYIIAALDAHYEIFHGLLIKAAVAFQEWRPEKNKWSLHEIVCHLLDEEQHDFKARIKHILETPEKEMPSIDPESWVTTKNYAHWDYNDTINRFLKERKDSVRYLYSLENENWQTVYQHSKLGAMTAEKFLHNWLAHDYLHIRQINKYQYLFFKEKSGIDLDYAGDW